MVMVVGDVGGTNARLALVRDGAIDAATITRFRGDDFARFDDVVTRFLDEQGRPSVDAVCVAVAGPVAGGAARLTNRDWDFTETRLRDLTGAGRAVLMNDLTALGFATAALSGDGVAMLRAAPETRAQNGQALVVGFGTGFNVCATRTQAGQTVALEAEEGHTTLPAPIWRALSDRIGAQADAFPTTEDLFAGRGLAALHAALTAAAPCRAEDVVTAADAGDAAARATCAFFAELAGVLCRDLALRFMPLAGLYLAGSVGRSLAARMDDFTRGFLGNPLMAHIPQNTPILLIRDDMAALQGCLVAAGAAR
ncbi:glucokinase [Paracoccus sp. (in: a-proteobacteria)]|uniref:glucokinase n=1 Tax=Paracoccus sp. TaxID=267 RepID=UPI0026E113A1|nr:glucokinase [Paracoccus sp. (in: a-proteobacteria)]MDO5647025.1 glucokinase [Paracoccus sp. (in: a-proteobacteria)]